MSRTPSQRRDSPATASTIWGHGLSGGTRAFVPDGWLSVDDLAQLHDIVSAHHDSLPAFVLRAQHGRSDRTRIRPTLSRTLARHGHHRRSSAQRVRPSALAGGACCLWAAQYIPKVRLSPPVFPKVLTHDDELLRIWRDDPLVDKGMWRVGTSAALALMARDIRKDAQELDLPLLILHGEEDHLAPASGSRFLAEKSRVIRGRPARLSRIAPRAWSTKPAATKSSHPSATGCWRGCSNARPAFTRTVVGARRCIARRTQRLPPHPNPNNAH